MIRVLKANRGFVLGSVAALLLFFTAFLVLPGVFKESYVFDELKESVSASTSTEPVFVVRHVPSPDSARGIYMTACVAGTPSWRTSLKNFIKETELNSVILDIKDFSGTISFKDPSFEQEGLSGCRVSDMREFIDELHEENIYVVGRVTVFQDPHYTKLYPELAVKRESDGAVWKDYKGLSFVDVGARPYWDYVVNIAKKSYAIGFDEINFDYIRYPSDGNMKDIAYTWTVGTSTRAEMLKGFYKHLRDELGDTGMKISADLFGMTTTHPNDLGIGQILEDALTYFDYVYPMVYPSHYPASWNGFAKPATMPYEVIKIAMDGAIRKETALRESLGIATSTPSKIRPWLQDFDLGAQYGVAEVRAQIQATYDAGINSWFMWDASNKYTKEAYLPE